jgi:hypothetical protein
VGASLTYQEAEIQRTAIFAWDETNQIFRACEVDANGVLSTTAGSGGGGSGGDVRIKDATLSQFASVDASGRLTVNIAGTVPIAGSVALDGPTLAALETITVGGTVAVSNFPATQPISGSVSVSNFPATQPVSGTVSISGSVAVTGPLTDAQLRASAVPVSLASVPSHAVTGPLTNTELRAAAVPVSQTTLPPLVAGTARVGAVRLVDSADADLTTTKWTVPAGRFQAVTDAKDLGRTLVVFSAGAAGNGYTSVAAAATLITFAWSKDHGALANGTSYTVPAGKRLRIVGGWVMERSTTGNTTTAISFLRMRGTTGAALAVGSPLQAQFFALHPNTASAISNGHPLPFPDDIEMQAGWVFGFDHSSTGWVATTCVPLWEFSIVAFEY